MLRHPTPKDAASLALVQAEADQQLRRTISQIWQSLPKESRNLEKLFSEFERLANRALFCFGEDFKHAQSLLNEAEPTAPDDLSRFRARH